MSDRLCQENIDCSIDQYEQSPEGGWPQWYEKQVEQSTFVLVACTETYLRRFRGEEAPGRGLGGLWEGHVITQELYNAQGKNSKFIPITFSREDVEFIPLPLQSATYYQPDRDYELLYRRLTDQHLIPKPVLGSIRPMPPKPRRERRQDFQPPWQVPHPRNVFFTGREKVLADLRQALNARGVAALGGLGGLGKTQTAIEYSYRYREHYKAVFWAKAESREMLLADFVSIAYLLNLPSAVAKDPEVAAADVKRWLESNPGWLLILDNAGDLPLVQAFLPNQGKGHLVLTTRARATAVLAEPISVRDMAPEEGALLLLRRARLISKDALVTDAGETDRRFALQLSKELGGLPLALDQAGAFIEETRRSLAEYAELYALEKVNLLAVRGTLNDHPSVAVTFSLAFEKVAANSAVAADLLRVCAFLAPNAIPEEIFTKGASALGENLCAVANDKLGFARAIGEAARFSVVDRDALNRTLGIHRLVQIVIKAGMSESDRKDWAERAVRATEKAFPYGEYADWPLCQKLIPHAQTCASLISEWDFGFAEAAMLLNRAAYYLGEHALFAEAEPMYQRSLAIRAKTSGPDHPEVARSLRKLAVLYDHQGKYAYAEPLYQRSLAIWEKILGSDHPEVARSLDDLAVLYDHRGKYAYAEPLYQRSLAISEKILGSDHPEVAKSLNNLAVLYDHQRKYTEAEPLYQRSLAIREKALGRGHPDVAVTLNNLAVLYDHQRKYTEAEPLYRRSLAIREKTLGPDHPDVAWSLNRLAGLYSSQVKYAEAEPLYQRLLAIREKALGPDHPDVGRSLNSLALLYDSQGKYAEAAPLYQRSLAIYEKALGPDHPYTRLVRSNLDSLRKRRTTSAE